ncbi:hypothetical protein [Streptomyces sp. NPDC048277]|uniref:hypothetical protein n=1 Tax=Streptomyces sp. NPDC048277 TaxID=3155027 RepID=UPI0033DC3B1D
MTVRSAWLSPDGQSREDTRANQAGALTPATDSTGRSGGAVLIGIGARLRTAGSVSTVFRYALTAGTSYTVTALHRSSDSAVTCTVDNIFVPVDPAN